MGEKQDLVIERKGGGGDERKLDEVNTQKKYGPPIGG